MVNAVSLLFICWGLAPRPTLQFRRLGCTPHLLIPAASLRSPCRRNERGKSGGGAARVTSTRDRVGDEWETHDLDLNLEDEALFSPDKEAGDFRFSAAAEQGTALEADLEGGLDSNEDAEEDEAISRILSSERATRESPAAFAKRDSRKALRNLLNSNPEFHHSDELVSKCSGVEDEETASGIEDSEELRHAEAALHSIAAMSEDKKQRKALQSETEMYEYARSVLSEGAVMQLLRRKFFDPKHVTGPVVDDLKDHLTEADELVAEHQNDVDILSTDGTQRAGEERGLHRGLLAGEESAAEW